MMPSIQDPKDIDFLNEENYQRIFMGLNPLHKTYNQLTLSKSHGDFFFFTAAAEHDSEDLLAVGSILPQLLQFLQMDADAQHFTDDAVFIEATWYLVKLQAWTCNQNVE